MGVKERSWQDDFVTAIIDIGVAVEFLPSSIYTLLKLNHSDQLLINLISIDNPFSAEELLALQAKWKEENTQVINLWEDVWLSKPAQVLGRLSSVLGLNKRVHGRKTKIISVTQEVANTFYNKFHLQGTAGCKYRYALEIEGEIIAIAGFSDKRKMIQHKEPYNSVELIRFATIHGFTVTGGLSKLIKHFIKTVLPNDVMSYADMDWSEGSGYIALGFKLVTQTAPILMFLDKNTLQRYFPHRLPAALLKETADMDEAEKADYLKMKNYTSVFNTGNLKYILYL